MPANHRNTLPTREQRDHLLNVVYGHDPQPPQCRLHSAARAAELDCEICKTFDLWRQRMYRRFRERSLKFTFDDRAYGDPEPRCPLGHADNAANRKVCEHCKARQNWRGRQYRRMRREGIDRVFTDWDVLLSHLHQLRDAGMLTQDITRAAPCSEFAVEQLLRGAEGRKFVRADVARRLLAVPIPERRLRLVPSADGSLRRRVDATGTHRRIQAACRAGHSMPAQSRRLGWSDRAMRHWLAEDTVTVDVADAVAVLFPKLIARPGGDKTAVTIAARKGWLEARYFSATNIDDPAYNPFAIVGNPVGVYRQLRALAWMGQGPRQVAAFIGEAPEQIEIWMEGGPAPAYAAHMVDAAFEALSGTAGPDDQVAERARNLGWAPPLAWYGVDVDNVYARPFVDLPTRERKTAYPLQSQVDMALMGKVPAGELFHAEKMSVVRYLHQWGWSDRRIAAWLRWNPDGDLDKGRDAVCAFRTREGITGGGPDLFGRSNLDAEEGWLVAPSTA